ncbi:hypothetical protein IC232_03285 [Microvirga sp. BT688]|uniref:hypothetical protein n=1 Tax=Microvirga sp. TaxID=1873136 RepID=UPI001682F702|nr:hypothetical protein [Microvirga sp.]MBD2745712.1 hypothetical protein [Microvirga sp.]
MEQLGGDTLTTFENAANETVQTLETAAGDTFATIEKAGEDSLTTIYKAAEDAAVTYVKAWQDVGEQAQRSFDDAVDAGKAAARFLENQRKAEWDAVENNEKRLRDGKVIDAMWGLGTEPLQSGEQNFAKATQESEVINAAAATAAGVYGGPAGAAAYAAWSTYRRTGNADMALRAGLLSAATSYTGSSVAQMPATTTTEIVKKAAMAGAAGGIAVAAAGGDEEAIKDGFLTSAGAVLVQAGTEELEAYAPEAKDAYDQAKDAYDTVQCISATDVDCLSKTTWARDAKGQILEDENGDPIMAADKLDPNEYIGKWTQLDPNTPEGKAAAIIAQTSKLPEKYKLTEKDAIPILDNEWVLTWTVGQEQNIEYAKPTVVLTYVGKDPPFTSSVEYSEPNILIAYYVKPADGSRITDALEGSSIPYTRMYKIAPGHENVLTNALICGPDTPVDELQRVAFALIDAGVDIKYIGSKSTYKPRQILILNLLNNAYPLNNANITRDQVADLAECPAALKNP